MKKTIVFSAFLLALALGSCKKSDGLNAIKSAEEDATATTQVLDFENRNVDSLAIKSMDINNQTTIAFEKTDFDFGIIKSGDVVNYAFKFTNSGTKNLIIKDAKVSCGCTITDFPKEPMAPGATGEIKVRFDSARKSGRQLKSINVYGNIPNGKQILYIRATINK